MILNLHEEKTTCPKSYTTILLVSFIKQDYSIIMNAMYSVYCIGCCMQLPVSHEPGACYGTLLLVLQVDLAMSLIHINLDEVNSVVEVDAWFRDSICQAI